MDNLAGRVVSENVGHPRTVSFRGKDIKTSIWKEPVGGTVAIAGVLLPALELPASWISWGRHRLARRPQSRHVDHE